MRAFLCWNCGKLGSCLKVFPDGRPKRVGDCVEYTALPPNPPRISQREMADVLGCSARRVAELVSSNRGRTYIKKALARHGITVISRRNRNKIYFYREEE